MRITYRNKNTKNYWEERWSSIPVDNVPNNELIYPLKYALETVADIQGKILEAGCGAGRVLRYFHNRGYDIVGIDYVDIAVKKVKEFDPSLKVFEGDITKLKFKDKSFRYLLAFGLYHGIQEQLDEAISETFRVLEEGGKVCASFRADNICTQFTDWLQSRGKQDYSANIFHKRNLTRSEFINLFISHGFVVEKIYPVENMPILFKFGVFRHKNHKKINESLARSEGYQLNSFGEFLQRLLMKLFANHFCNLYVLIARRPQ